MPHAFSLNDEIHAVYKLITVSRHCTSTLSDLYPAVDQYCSNDHRDQVPSRAVGAILLSSVTLSPPRRFKNVEGNLSVCSAGFGM